MRVHAEKVIRRRRGITELKNYREAKENLIDDFSNLCGYCGKNGKIMHENFHIDHFVPRSLDAGRENDYYNLVLACPKCNLAKSNKWPTEDKNRSNDGTVGFVDPATDEFDVHMERSIDGYVVGKTVLGKNMCRLLNLHIRRTDLYWKISEILRQQTEMEKLFVEGKLKENEKDFYIQANIILKNIIDEAFAKGE